MSTKLVRLSDKQCVRFQEPEMPENPVLWNPPDSGSRSVQQCFDVCLLMKEYTVDH